MKKNRKRRLAILVGAIAVLWAHPGRADSDGAKAAKCLADLKMLKTCAIRFKTMYGRYPSAEEGLSVFAEKPVDWNLDRDWKPLARKGALKDPWGNPYVSLGAHAEDGFRIYSKGSDGISESAGMDPDDLNTWSPEHRGRFYESLVQR